MKREVIGTITQSQVMKHASNPVHVANFLQGRRITTPKKGKGSYRRREKHRKMYD